MRKFIAFIALIATLGFAYQAYVYHTLATILGFLGGTIGFLTALANMKSDKKKDANITQTIGDNSSGIQVGGDMTVNKKDDK